MHLNDLSYMQECMHSKGLSFIPLDGGCAQPVWEHMQRSTHVRTCSNQQRCTIARAYCDIICDKIEAPEPAVGVDDLLP